MSVGVVNKQTGERIPTAGMPAIDNALDLTSVNPVQNAVITAALDGKADTGIVADDFDSTASYVIGNYCIKDGKLYRFKANHSGAWAAADVEEIQIAGELSSIKSGLKNYTVLGTVTADGVKTYAQLLVELYAYLPSGITKCAVIYNNIAVFRMAQRENNGSRFYRVHSDSNGVYIQTLRMSGTSGSNVTVTISPQGAISFIDGSDTVLSEGRVISIVF